MWSSCCLLCELLFNYPFSCQGNSDAASGGASGSVYTEPSRPWWFSEGSRLVQADGDLERGDPPGRGGRSAAGRWAALVRTHLFPQSRRKPTLGQAPQIQGGGSRGQKVCVRLQQVQSLCRPSSQQQAEWVSGHWQCLCGQLRVRGLAGD